MGTMKRLMALMVCIAMLVSGFALADDASDPTQPDGQGTTQQTDVLDETGGGSTISSELSGTPTLEGKAQGQDTTSEDEEENKEEVKEEVKEEDKENDPSLISEPQATALEGDDEEECTHAETERHIVDTEYVGGFVSLNDAMHAVEAVDSWEEVCVYCGEVLNSGTSDPYMVQEEHSFSSESGVKKCTICEYTSDCAHTSTKWNEVDYPGGEAKPLGDDAEMHLATFYKYREEICTTCGALLNFEEPEPYEKKEAHEYEYGDGKRVCTVCGYETTCDHPADFVTIDKGIEPDYSLDNYVVSSNSTKHTIKARKWEESHCERCDARWDRKITEYLTVEDPHEWDKASGGKVCRICGAQNECSHTNWSWTNEVPDVFRATKIDEHSHTAEYVTYADKKCDDCGLIIEERAEMDSWTQTDDHFFDQFSDGSVACLNCGYVVPCTHPYPYVVQLTRKGYTAMDPKYNDAMYHTVSRYDQTYYRCRICHQEWGWDNPEYEAPVRVQEKHQWDGNGVCKICGHPNTCKPHDFQPTGKTWDGNYACDILDDVSHSVTICRFEELACTKCGVTTSRIIEGSEQTFDEEHYWTADGRCAVCGIQGYCQHPAEYVEKLTGTQSRDDLKPIKKNENEHTVYADRYEWYHCKRCDTYWGYEVVEYCVEQTEPHTWGGEDGDGSECIYCHQANPCKHEGTTEPYEREQFRAIPSKTTATTHTLEIYTVKGLHCTKCGAELLPSFEDEGESGSSAPRYVTEPHKFVYKEGKTVCEVCNYIRPTEKAPVVTTKTKEKADVTFEEVANGTVLHGVTVGESAPMGVTLAKAAQGIVADYGPDTKIAIRDIDKVLNAQECAALEALQPVDRILVALSALGYSGEVNRALSELNLTLSEDARALIITINARVAAMSADDLAARQAAIEKYFPAANGVSITLEIRASGKSLRLERYSFVKVGEEWQFTKLEVAKT